MPDRRNRLLVVTDAWLPQTNGVVTTLVQVIAELGSLGFVTTVVHPGMFRTVPLPSYPEIRIALDHPWRVGEQLRAHSECSVHIATEGPLGLAARALCLRRHIPFTTSLHTKFPEYVNERIAIPLEWGYRFLRWFHAPSAATLVTTPTHRAELAERGFEHLVVWGRGVNTQDFKPMQRPRRVARKYLYVGRVAVEKNIDAFLRLELPGEKVVVGDGPARAELQARYPTASWTGFRHGAELAAFYADADVLVFPSLTDTYGLVMLEANACGTPVAAFPVTGPKDVVHDGVNGALDVDLGRAVSRAIGIDRASCRAFAERHGWRTIAERLVENLVFVS